MIQTAINEVNYKLPFSIKDIMKSWVTQPGFPIVQVTRNYSAQIIQLQQTSFSENQTAVKDKNLTWYIPINFATGSNPDFDKTVPDIWLKDPSMNVSVETKPEDWLILNKQQTG